MYDVLRFWLDRGIDGFRVDVIWHLSKDDQFRDNPPNPGWTPEQLPHERFLQRYNTDRPEIHEVVTDLRNVLEEYEDHRLLIGEIYLPIERLVTYYGRDLKGAQIGSASCRERVGQYGVDLVGRRIIKKKKAKYN